MAAIAGRARRGHGRSHKSWIRADLARDCRMASIHATGLSARMPYHPRSARIASDCR
jgi:hypothetical protein